MSSFVKKRVPVHTVFVCLCLALLLLMACGTGHGYLKKELKYIEIYKKVRKGVVNITSISITYDFFYRPVPVSGVGSGVIISKKGYIVTNYHVVGNAKKLEVTLSDGSKWPAKVVGVARKSDLAVIRISAPAEKLTPLKFGDSRSLKVGQEVLAVGNPFGLKQTLTAGTISFIGRNIRDEKGRIFRDLIQTDAAINPGNSGGPLLNTDGEVIGINSAIISPTGSNIGIGFAIPSHKVKALLPGLLGPWARWLSYLFAIIFLWFIFKMVFRKRKHGY